MKRTHYITNIEGQAEYGTFSDYAFNVEELRATYDAAFGVGKWELVSTEQKQDDVHVVIRRK